MARDIRLVERRGMDHRFDAMAREGALDHCSLRHRTDEMGVGDMQTARLQSATAFAHFLAGRYDDASSWAQRALQVRPSYPSAIRLAAASSALAGRPEEARQAIERLRQVDPALRVSNLKDRVPLRRPDDLTRYQEGLRIAGLPEE
jgi:tetratricopeptide (TPR) repeat protein